MENLYSRTELLIGKDSLNKIKKFKIAIFGLGGVGSYVAEALARVGIGHFILIDNDIVSKSNINRQLIALNSTVGKLKVDIEKDRILDINPNAIVETYPIFFLKNENNIIDNSIDYVIDAIDTVTGKLEIIQSSKDLNINIISCMGTGNKLDPSKLEITDIYKTTMCPLAKIMRKELKNRGIQKLKVLYSKEKPIELNKTYEEQLLKDNKNKRQIPGSISFVPSVAGLIIASEVIKDLIK